MDPYVIIKLKIYEVEVLVMIVNSSDTLFPAKSVAINLILTSSKSIGVPSNYLSYSLKTNHLGNGFPSACSAL